MNGGDAEPWVPLPLPPQPAPERDSPRNWLCPVCSVALQDIRPAVSGWIGWCPLHRVQLGSQARHSQEPENHPEEESDECDD